MASKKNRRKTQIKLKPVKTNCPFCKGDFEPNYKNYSDLAKYINDRAKLMPKSRTGLCAKHQRRLSVEIKRARSLALLPYMGSLS